MKSLNKFLNYVKGAFNIGSNCVKGAIAIGLASVVIGCASPPNKHGPYEAAVRTEQRVEDYVSGIERIIEDKKIDSKEFSALQDVRGYLKDIQKTVDEAYEKAQLKKNDAASGALDKVRQEVNDLNSIVSRLNEYCQKNGTANIGIGFNLINGKALSKKAWDNYTVNVPVNEAKERFKQAMEKPGAWTKVSVNVVSYFVERMEDEQARDALDYVLRKGIVDASSVHVRANGVTSNIEESGMEQLRKDLDNFRNKYMKQQTKSKEKKQEKPKK